MKKKLLYPLIVLGFFALIIFTAAFVEADLNYLNPFYWERDGRLAFAIFYIIFMIIAIVLGSYIDEENK